MKRTGNKRIGRRGKDVGLIACSDVSLQRHTNTTKMGRQWRIVGIFFIAEISAGLFECMQRRARHLGFVV